MKGDKRSTHAANPGEGTGSVDAALRAAVASAALQGTLACAEAFSIAARIGRPPAEVGQTADLLQIRLVKCQLGLFGYAPEKKIVDAAPAVNPDLAAAIREKLQGGRLACFQAWELSQKFNLPRMAVSAACEALGVKIKPCQLGAF